MEPKTKEQLLAELNAYVRSAGDGGKTTAADVRQFLISLVEELFTRTDEQTSNFTIEQDLTSNSSTSAPSVQAVKGALDASATDNLATTELAISASSVLNRDRANHTGTQTVATISDFTNAVGGLLLAYDTKLKDGVPVAGNTLKKLHSLIIGQFSEVTVATIAARNSYKVSKLPTNVFVTDDGDGRWALYRATSTGTNAVYVKLSDPDLLGAVMSAGQIKVAYESNPDTNAFTNALLDKLNSFVIEQSLSSNSTAAVPSISAVKSSIDTVTGQLSILSTSTKTNLVDAINESFNKVIIDSNMSSGIYNAVPTSNAIRNYVGFTSTLSTTSKTSITAAINETYYKTNSAFVGYRRSGEPLYRDLLEDLLEDPSMRFGRVVMRVARYYMYRSCLNTQVEIIDGGGWIYTNNHSLRVPAYSRGLRFYCGTLGSGDGKLLPANVFTLLVNRITRFHDCELVNTNIDLDNKYVELINVKILEQYNGAYQYTSGTGTLILKGATAIQDNLSSVTTVTIIDERPSALPLLLLQPVVTGDHTLSVVSGGKVLPVSSATPVTVTLPAETGNELFPVGFVAEIAQESDGQVTVAGAAGVTLQYFGGLKTAGKYASVQILKIANNVWRVTNGVA